ncbi:substrate-binding periplasmic protein [Chromobacterium sp.]|uniref:substrate-binding periplasmic protein n=1 Tax=Chromobacterium sp. TaxID=306190 RepID=UPI0035B42241
MRWKPGWAEVAAGLLALLLAAPAPAAGLTLRAGVANDSFGPLFSAQDGVLAGQYRAALEQIGRLSGIRFELEYYPSSRLQQLFEVAKVDVEVGVNPSWRALSPVAGFYTKPIDVQALRLCFAAGKRRKGALPAGLSGLSVGVLQGRVYPALEPGFASGQLKRMEAASEYDLLGGLRQGRMQAIVLSQRQLDTLLSHSPEAPPCVPGESVGSVPVMLRLHPQYRQLLPQLDKAIQQLQDSGKLR